MDIRHPVLIAALSVGTLTASLAAGSAARAEPIQGQVTFTTSLIDYEHPAGAEVGTLQLTFGHGGTILGYFRPVDSSRFFQVNGGLDGDKIFLNIDGQQPINGTYKDGKIVGYEYVNERTHQFTALPASEPNT